MWNMFHEKSSQYHLRSKNLSMLLQTNTFRYGNDSLKAASYAFQMTLKAKPRLLF